MLVFLFFQAIDITVHGYIQQLERGFTDSGLQNMVLCVRHLKSTLCSWRQCSVYLFVGSMMLIACSEAARSGD